MLNERKIVTWALIILFLALAVVYSLAYMRNTDAFKAKSDNNQNTIDENITTAVVNTQPSWDNISNTQTQIQVNIPNPSETKPNEVESTNQPVQVQLLPKTVQYQGTLDVIDILWVQPDFILQDDRWDYFASYGSKGLDFAKTIQNLWGNVYAMVTEAEILKNDLFGDKVSYINMAAFKDKFVIMVIEIQGKTWLLQVPSTTYHSSKAYLKSLFM